MQCLAHRTAAVPGHHGLRASTAVRLLPNTGRWQCSSAAPLVSSGSRNNNVQAGAAAQSSGIENLRHITSDGWGLELLLQRAQGDSTRRPPLLFVHGSYHGAWCWAEHFMPFFAQRGYTCYAVSLRAQGNSDCISNDKESAVLVAGTLDSHAQDLADLIAEISLNGAPVVIGHSFGGLILQKYIGGMKASSTDSDSKGYPRIAGTGFLCCVPPSGNKQMVWRFIRKDPLLSIKVTWGFVAKSFATSVDACKDLFFSPDIPPTDLARYQKQLAACSPVRLIDLQDVNRQVPLPGPPKHAPPTFVLGAENDKVVDIPAIQELATVYGVEPVLVKNMAHDAMLDTRWVEAAQALEAWLEKTVRPSLK